MNRAQSPETGMNGLARAQTPLNGPGASKDAVELGMATGARQGMWAYMSSEMRGWGRWDSVGAESLGHWGPAHSDSGSRDAVVGHWRGPRYGTRVEATRRHSVTGHVTQELGTTVRGVQDTQILGSVGSTTSQRSSDGAADPGRAVDPGCWVAARLQAPAGQECWVRVHMASAAGRPDHDEWAAASKDAVELGTRTGSSPGTWARVKDV